MHSKIKLEGFTDVQFWLCHPFPHSEWGRLLWSHLPFLKRECFDLISCFLFMFWDLCLVRWESTVGFHKCMFSFFLISETCCLRYSMSEWSFLFSFSRNFILYGEFLTCDINYWEFMHHGNMNGAIDFFLVVIQLLRI